MGGRGCSPYYFTVVWCLQALPYFCKVGGIASRVMHGYVKVVAKVLAFAAYIR